MDCLIDVSFLVDRVDREQRAGERTGGGADAGIDGADSRAAQAPRPPVLATLRRPTISAPFPTLSRQNGIRATWNEPAAGTDDSPTGLSRAAVRGSPASREGQRAAASATRGGRPPQRGATTS